MKIDPQRLHRLRKQKGLSRARLAERSTISERTIQRLENEGSIREPYAYVIDCLERQEVGLWTSKVSRRGFRQHAG